MALYAIADLHLSFGTNKPMDIFKGWTNYVERLEKNWREIVAENDTVVIVGDISWAMRLEEAFKDFKFIDSLPGKKIFIKGNHDYWWTTKKKMDEYILRSGFSSITILSNDCIPVENFAVCGTRGWSYDCSSSEDVKILNREVGRLILSLDQAKKFDLEPIVFLHYPPVFSDYECTEILEVLRKYGIKKCYYGHIHGKNVANKAITGIYKEINFSLVSCDQVDFKPVLVI